MLDEETAVIAEDVSEVVRDNGFQLIFADFDRNNDGVVSPIEYYNHEVKFETKCLVNPEPHRRTVRNFLLGLQTR